jgi:hypothetical protein
VFFSKKFPRETWHEDYLPHYPNTANVAFLVIEIFPGTYSIAFIDLIHVYSILEPRGWIKKWLVIIQGIS